MEICKKKYNMSFNENQSCEKNCDQIYDDYKKELIHRYKDEN